MAATCLYLAEHAGGHVAGCKPAWYGSMGGFIVGGGHGPAGDGGPGIPVESEPCVQAIADPQSIVECLCCGDRYVAVIQSSAF